MRSLKTTWVALVGASLILAACSGSDGDTTPAAASGEEKTAAEADTSTDGDDAKGEAVAGGDAECTVGFSQATMNHPWRVAMVEGNQEYAEENLPNVELIVTDGQNEATKQVSDVESLLAQNIDVLLLSPLTADALTPIAQQAMEQGVPVITLDREVNAAVTSHIGAQNRPIGVAAGEFIAEELGGEGKIIEIQGTAGASATVDRHEGFREAVDAADGLEVVAEQHADYLREDAVSFMEDMVQRFGVDGFDAVYAHNDEMALGAVTALKEAGANLEEIVVVGIDGQNTAIDAVQAGDLDATFVYPFVAPEGVQHAAQVCAGEEVPESVTLESTGISQSNVEEYVGEGF